MPEAELALALAELRSALEVGLAKIDGQLAVLVQRSDQTERSLDDLEQRVSALERARWPVPALTVIVSVIGAAVGVYGVLHR
ncbi:hypothetical protein ACFCXR_15300 [Streptomyces noursei]|uniref:hypothetical protein n=1 Tax=Streptomyces noursei TaxID=1971 RepID=UPI00045F0432|nr:hypothetical protein [Streptomyces noursei]AIA03438.1 hypothetical protein DC74_2938 [Streptomyces noursei]